MTVHVKSALLLFAALLLGAVMGALGAAALINNRVEQLQALRGPGAFAPFMERVIEPTDEAQREQIRAILEDAGQRQRQLRRSLHVQHRALMDSVRTELRQVLTPEQQARLDAWHREARPRGPRGDGPRFRRRGSGFPPDSLAPRD